MSGACGHEDCAATANGPRKCGMPAVARDALAVRRPATAVDDVLERVALTLRRLVDTSRSDVVDIERDGDREQSLEIGAVRGRAE